MNVKHARLLRQAIRETARDLAENAPPGMAVHPYDARKAARALGKLVSRLWPVTHRTRGRAGRWLRDVSAGFPPISLQTAAARIEACR